MLRIVLFTAEGAGVHDRCRIAGDVVTAFISVPIEYLVAISTPLLHHLGGIGTILGAVLEEPLRENEYNQVRTIMLPIAQLLDNLELLHRGVRVSEILKIQVSRIDECMNAHRQPGSLRQSVDELNLSPMSALNGHEPRLSEQIDPDTSMVLHMLERALPSKCSNHTQSTNYLPSYRHASLYH